MASWLERGRRIWRHRWIDHADLERALPPEALARLEAQVAASERRHSGELRLCIEAGLPMSYLWRDAPARERALMLFGKLRVWDTAQNNGVLIYLLLAEHAIEIVADRGLSAKVDARAWQALAAHMAGAFRAGRFEEGLAEALDRVGALLVQHFPRTDGAADVNELPDAPVLL